MHLDIRTGTFTPSSLQSRRTVGELVGLFADHRAAEEVAPETLVYEVHGSSDEAEGAPRLLYATTVIQPGNVGGEYFMTRGHFHTDPARGEFMLTLGGEGALILMDRQRLTWSEPMTEGSLHDIDGRHAHRVANAGSVPLVFLVTWMSDCGHDYAPILAHGFSSRLVRASMDRC